MLLKNEKLKDFNIAFYAMVMGFGGFTLANYKLQEVFKLKIDFAFYLLIFTLILFLIVSFGYLIKLFNNFSGVKGDFKHNVRSNFFPGIGIVFLILSIGLLNINILIAKIFWIIGVIILSIFAVILFRRWILHTIDIKELTPLWFLPIVGNMLVPIGGVKLGFIELSWFYFSIGIIMWGILFTILLNRLIFHTKMPEKLLPTLFILIAPPSVGFISITLLNGGVVNDFGKILYYFAIFLFIVMFSKINVLRKIKFYLSWWAYSFPIAVLTTASIFFYSKTGFDFMKYLSIGFYFILVLIIIFLSIKTIIGISKNDFCVEE